MGTPVTGMSPARLRDLRQQTGQVVRKVRTGVTTKALLLENIHPDASARLAKEGYQVDTLTRALSEDELIEAIGGVNLLGIRSGTQVTERVLDAAPDLVAIGAFCIGVNQIDVAAASRRGVAVFNAPFSNTRSVVELALAEIISMARRLPEKNAQMHEGQWDKSAAGSHEVRGRKIGIVGYGNIGTQLSVLAENLGMAVYFYDIADKLALGNARRCSTLTELLESVETVTLHVDGRDGNHGFFGAAEFASMRPRSLFLNLSRGFVVDHAALRRNIESGHIAGAAIDVFPEEPKGKGDEFVSELRGLPNVILTPHIGGSTEEAQQDIGEFVAGKLADYMATGATSLSVNLPEIALGVTGGTHRLVHLHQNVPGVLASINRVLADHGVNGFFGEEEFSRMNPRSLFLNLSRGFVVDHAALRRHIESGHIAGAAIDVFPKEPKGNGEEFVSELRGLPNVILTPHIGGSTEEAQQDIGEFVSGKLADFADGGATAMSVNLPNVALPAVPGTHRLIHLHQNVPGVLASINRVLAEHGVNVEGQLLRTRDDYGYVLTDISSEYSEDVLAELSAMPVTIRLRTLPSP